MHHTCCNTNGSLHEEPLLALVVLWLQLPLIQFWFFFLFFVFNFHFGQFLGSVIQLSQTWWGRYRGQQPGAHILQQPLSCCGRQVPLTSSKYPNYASATSSCARGFDRTNPDSGERSRIWGPLRENSAVKRPCWRTRPTQSGSSAQLYNSVREQAVGILARVKDAAVKPLCDVGLATGPTQARKVVALIRTVANGLFIKAFQSSAF